jgi:hypothetical protein
LTIPSLADGIVYNIISNELIEIHVGDILEDSNGNRSKVVSVGGMAGKELNFRIELVEVLH